MLSSCRVQIDLTSRTDQRLFSRRALGNTLKDTIMAAYTKCINLENLSIERTILLNNIHLTKKINNFLVIHQDGEYGRKLIETLKNIGHWGEYFPGPYEALKSYVPRPFYYHAIIMDGNQNSEHSTMIISKLFLARARPKLFIQSEKIFNPKLLKDLNIDIISKDFCPRKQFSPAY